MLLKADMSGRALWRSGLGASTASALRAPAFSHSKPVQRGGRGYAPSRVMNSDENGTSSSPGIKYILTNGLVDYYEVTNPY